MNDKNFSTTISVETVPKTAFDAITNVRAWWSQTIQGDTKSLGDVFGIKDISGTLAGLQQDAAARGVDTNLLGMKYDPALGQIESLGKILAYSGASAIAGQTGNALSNKDVENVSQILGDPHDWAMNQQRFLVKLQQVEDYVNGQMQVNSKYLFGQPGAVNPARTPTMPAPAPTGYKILKVE